MLLVHVKKHYSDNWELTCGAPRGGREVLSEHACLHPDDCILMIADGVVMAVEGDFQMPRGRIRSGVSREYARSLHSDVGYACAMRVQGGPHGAAPESCR